MSFNNKKMYVFSFVCIYVSIHACIQCEIISVSDVIKILSYYSPSNTKFSSQISKLISLLPTPALRVPSPILPNVLYYLHPTFIREGRVGTDWDIAQQSVFLVTVQLDAQILFNVFIYSSLHVSSMTCSSSGETNSINTTSGNCHSINK